MKKVRLKKKLFSPEVTEVVCVACQETQEAVWTPYGSEFPCVYCDSAPVNLVKKEQKKNHKMTKEVTQQYVSADCSCGDWSVFHNQRRAPGFDRVNYIKSEFKTHVQKEKGQQWN